MAKCAPGCSCNRHTKVGKKCPPSCTCARHEVTDQRRSNISASLKGRPLSPEHRASLKCKPDCTCDKHRLQNSGQFQPGSAGFTRRHTTKTKAKLASYTGEQASSYKHGWAGTPTYVSWHAMLGRCADRGNASFKHYGARGITVCARWLDFVAFLEDMGERPSLDHSIDRIDNDGNYEPSNCRWATREQQNRNRRDPGGWTTRRARQQS